LRENNLDRSALLTAMHVSSEYKLSALLKGGAETAQRALDAATQLRAAVTPERLRERWAGLGARPVLRFLVSPHELLASQAATGIAIAVAACSVAIAIVAEVHFDGALDVHRVKGLLGPMTLTADLAISWVLVASILWIASLMADRAPGREGERRPTLRAFLIAVGVARLPTLLIALCIAVLPQPQMLVESLLRGIVLLPLFAWHVGLLYTGFGHVSGLRGQPALIPFLAGLVIAEAISKAIIGSV
jgi:hypothetical protein